MASRMERSHLGARRAALSSKLFSISTIIAFMSILSAAVAYDMEADNRAYESRHFKKLERLGQIHIDQRQPPPAPGTIRRRGDEGGTEARAESSLPSSLISPSTTLIASAPASLTTVATSTVDGTVIATPLPVPFDTSLGSNFTSGNCPAYFETFLNNATFKSCAPVSLLLQNSNSFFRAERDASLLSETLNIACDAPLAICSPLMAALSQDLIATSHCGADYSLQNPLVMQAYAGLVAYEPLYRATCLKKPNTGSYCFSDAITNSSAPADSYPYYTALGLSMPTSSRPSCDACLQDTMAIFADYAADKEQPLASTYPATSYQIGMECGLSFVNTTVAVAVTGSASNVRGGIHDVLVLLLVLVTAAIIS